jgi:hypothetical protein
MKIAETCSWFPSERRKSKKFFPKREDKKQKTLAFVRDMLYKIIEDCLL